MSRIKAQAGVKAGEIRLVDIDSFDYKGLSPERAKRLRVRQKRFAQVCVARQNRFWTLGRGLLHIKKNDLIGHGYFMNWVENACGLHRRVAQYYMNAAEFAGEQSESVSYLPPTTLYKLGKKSTPVAVVKKVKDRARSETPLTNAEVLSLIDENRPGLEIEGHSAAPKLLSQITKPAEIEDSEQRAWDAAVALTDLISLEDAQSVLAEILAFDPKLMWLQLAEVLLVVRSAISTKDDASPYQKDDPRKALWERCRSRRPGNEWPEMPELLRRDTANSAAEPQQ